MEQAIFQTILYSTLQKKSAVENSKEIGVNILIDDPQFSVAAILKYVKRQKMDFIFSLSNALVNNPGFDALFGKLFSLFTVSEFAGSPVIYLPILNIDGAKVENDELQKLQSYFKNQGESLNIIRVELSTQVISKSLFLYQDALGALSTEQIVNYKKQDINQIIFLPEYQVEEYVKVNSQRSIPTDNGQLDLLFSKVTIAKQLAIHVHQTQLWQNRAQLYLSFLTLSKEIGQGEYYSIKHWYHKEYEVLPLWYKQFGHIIKVLYRKRSFKSLFNKN
jgi:hypothetical protein